MTGLELLNKLNKLSGEQLSKEVYFSNEDVCSKVSHIEIVADRIYVDEYGEIVYESDYSEEELQQMIREGELSLVIDKNAISLSD